MGKVLYITSQSVGLYTTDRNSVELNGRFELNPTGYRQLREALLADRTEPIAVAVDLIEEEFRSETLPHANGRDRARLHERQAGKLFRTTPFRHSRVAGRLQNGRRDDLVLFSALTNRDNIEPVLALLEELNIPLAGIYSLPIVSRRLLKPLGIKGESVLLVTEQPDGGLRETFIKGNQVHFSRLAPSSSLSEEDYCRFLYAEIHKTHRYLHTLRLLSQDDTLKVYALSDSSRVDAMQRSVPDESNIEVIPANLGDLARRIGIKNHPDTRYSDLLFSYLPGKFRARNHYAMSSHLRRMRTHQLRRGMQAAMWLVAVGGLALSGTSLVDAMLMNKQTQDITQATRTVNERYQQVLNRLPIQSDDARAMREALQLAGLVKRQRYNPEPLFEMIGHAFRQQPDLKLVEFSWFTSAQANPGMSEQATGTRSDQQPLATEEYVITRIAGLFDQFNGNYLGAHQQIEQLAQTIRASGHASKVEIIKLPLETRTDAELQGEFGGRKKAEPAEFELRIVVEMNRESV